MLLDQGSSWRQRSRPQPINEAQDLGEQGPWDGSALPRIDGETESRIQTPGKPDFINGIGQKATCGTPFGNLGP